MEILREIKLNEYPCLICHEDITAESKIWSCNVCTRVFDVKCIYDWSVRKQLPDWKCPHCSAVHRDKPKHYRCWCKKVKNPDCDYDRPHSCGQTCGFRRKCQHPCTEICHPGSHPQCTAMGPTIKCWCGKTSHQDVCIKTRYDGFSCAQVCGKNLNCKKHKCELPCHEGKCPPCTNTKQARCYCGQTRRHIRCGEGKREKYRHLHGLFSCDKNCNKPLDCGNHQCEQKCHPRSGFKHACDKLPRPTDTCNCGKTLLSRLGKSRESCLDPTPSCRKFCEKLMPCGHKCSKKCHKGTCICDATVVKTCRCGQTRQTVECSQTVEPCTRKCGAPMSCGRHKCEIECCQFSAGKNRITKNMSIEDFLAAAASTMSDEELAVHLCTRECKRTLSCGNHTCQGVCHPGQCRRCLEAIHEDYECPCGKTVLRAPIRCGTVIPECKFLCPMVQPCGHKGTHKCHDPSKTPCPPCTAIVREACLCGKNTVARQCNSSKSPTCIYSCGKILDCGHSCPVICHSGECPPCRSKCGRPLQQCLHDHAHSSPCHGRTNCGDCEEQMIAKCPCGNLSVEYECGEEYQVFCNETCLNTEPPYHAVIIGIYQDRSAWAQKIESELREFVSGSKGAHGFKPMKKADRRFVHYLAEHYGLVGVSVDKGPQRSVRVSRTANTWVPKYRISPAIRLARIHNSFLPVYYQESDDIEDVGFSD